MKLYLLKPVNDWNDYDTAMGFVVAAACEDGARSYAAQESGDEGSAVWTHANYTTCVEIAKRTSHKAGVVLRDYAGT